MGSVDTGVAYGSGNACFYINICQGKGANVPGWTVGVVGALSNAKLCTDDVESSGVYRNGGEGLAGEFQLLRDKEGAITAARGNVGTGEMWGFGVITCQTKFYCVNPPEKKKESAPITTPTN